MQLSNTLLMQTGLPNFIRALSEHANHADDFFNAELLELISRCFQINDLAITVYQGRNFVQSRTTPRVQALVESYKKDFYKRDCVSQYVSQNLNSFIDTNSYSIVLGTEAFRQSENGEQEYKKFFEKLQIGHVAVLPVNEEFRIAIYKGIDSPDFSDVELDLLSALLCMIRNTFNAAQYRRFSEYSFSMMGRMLDANQIGYITFQEHLSQMRFNTTAAACLSEIGCGTSFNTTLARMMDHLTRVPSPCIYHGYRLQISERVSMDHGYAGGPAPQRYYCVAMMKIGEENPLSEQRKELPFDELSKREMEILGLFAKGESYTQIAAKLFISEGTVKTHLKNIYRKLGIENQRRLIFEYLSYCGGLNL